MGTLVAVQQEELLAPQRAWQPIAAPPAQVKVTVLIQTAVPNPDAATLPASWAVLGAMQLWNVVTVLATAMHYLTASGGRALAVVDVRASAVVAVDERAYWALQNDPPDVTAWEVDSLK